MTRRSQLGVKTALGVLLALVLTVAVVPNAEASPIQLSVKITLFPDVSGFGFEIFSNPTNEWPFGSLQRSAYLASGMSLGPGVTQHYVSLPVADLSQIYLSGSGSFFGDPNFVYQSIFVAAPPGGVDGLLAWIYGPPWISLASVGPGSPLSGELSVIDGDATVFVGTWEVSQVPEPSTWLLLGTGLALVAVRRRRWLRVRSPSLTPTALTD
jgi:hypothetical protein